MKTLTTVLLLIIQEVISLSVFAVFSVWKLGESFRWNCLVGFALIALGSWFLFMNLGKPLSIS